MHLYQINSSLIRAIEFQEKALVIHFVAGISPLLSEQLVAQVGSNSAFILGNKFGTTDLTKIKTLIDFLKDKSLISAKEYTLIQEQQVKPTIKPSAQETKSESVKSKTPCLLVPFAPNYNEAQTQLIQTLKTLQKKHSFIPVIIFLIQEKNYDIALMAICENIREPKIAIDLTQKLFEANKILKFNILSAACDEKGYSALHFAAINKNKELYDLLVAHGANIKLKDKAGNMPEFYFNNTPTPAVRFVVR